MNDLSELRELSHPYTRRKDLFDLKKSGRKPILLGRTVTFRKKRPYLKEPYFYIPPFDRRQTESIFIHGPNRSGKTSVALLFALQSYFLEGRSWIFFDSKGSIVGDTLIYVQINGIEQVMPIKDIVNNYIPHPVESHTAKTITDDVSVLSISDDHVARWQKVRQVSKHKPVGKLLKFTTRSGRTVISTKNHSFITLQRGKYIPIKGSDLTVGDHIPVADKIPFGNAEIVNTLDCFSREDIVDFDEIQSAVDRVKNEEGVPVTTVYRESGICSISYGAFWRYQNGERDFHLNHFKIKSANAARSNPFPKTIEMSNDFGFVCGMFVAEGRATNVPNCRRVQITNTSPILLGRIASWLDRTGLSYGFIEGDHIRIYSQPLAQLFTHWFGDGVTTNSGSKHLYPVIFNANEDFLKGFLDGYMSGDGTVRKIPRKEVSFTTKSEQLLTDLNLIFTKFGIPLRFRNSGYYSGVLHSSDTKKFKHIGFTHPKKHTRISEYPDKVKYDYKQFIDIDWVLRRLGQENVSPIVRNTILRKRNYISVPHASKIYEEIKESHPQISKTLKALIEGDVWWDKIVKVEEVISPSEYVYDLAINETENFMLANGMFVHNSYSGTWKKNDEETDTIQNIFGLTPTGFPTLGTNQRGEEVRLFHVIVPHYYARTLTPTDLKADAVTGFYRIPIEFLSLPLMCEITAIDPAKKYARRYDDVRKRVFSEVPNPRLDDVLAVLQEIIDKTRGNIRNIYESMKNKIAEEGDVSIQRQGVWSSVGEILREAAMDGIPRFIVVTFRHADSPMDERNQACYTAILDEVKRITELSKRYNWRLKLGVIADELYYYTRNKSASSWLATHDLLYRWGAGNWVLRIFCSLPPEERIWCIDPSDNLVRIAIGELVDGILERNPKDVKRYNDKNYECVEKPIDRWRVFTRNPDTMTVEVKPISRFIRHDNVDEIYHIVLEDGREVRVTGCHSIFTIDHTTMKPKKVMVSHLQKGDWIEFSTTMPFENALTELNIPNEFIKRNICLNAIKLRGEKYINFLWNNYYHELRSQFPSYDMFYNTKRCCQVRLKYLKNLPRSAYSTKVLKRFDVKMSAKPPSHPVKCVIPVNASLWWLLGLITGDGSVGNQLNHNTVALATELMYLKKARETFGEIFGIKKFTLDIDKRVKKTTKRDAESGELWIDNIVIWHLIHDIFNIHSPFSEKRAPDILFQQNEKSIGAYLKGLWEADGLHKKELNGKQWVLITKSTYLSKDVLQLWDKLGYLGRIKKYVHNDNYIYRVVVTQKNTAKTNTNFFPITYKTVEHIRLSEGIKNNAFIKRLTYNTKKRGYTTEYATQKIASLCNSDAFTKNFKVLVEGSSRFSRIVSIRKEQRNTKVYDISVDQYENFLSEDHIVCHNTQRDIQLGKEFTDSITNTKEASSFTYDVIIHTRKVPAVGYASILDRLHPIGPNSNLPRFTENVRICPSLCQVESEGE